MKKEGDLMKINTKCSLALHILLVVAVFSEQVKMTSENIAKSTGSNPVIIRNILGSLKRAGLVTVHRGSGGTELAMPPENINILAVYSSVDPSSMKGLIGLHPNPSKECPVGSRIHRLLEGPYDDIREAMQATMKNHTLADLLERYQAGMNVEEAGC
ncbi:MAG: Rrf2 family transcriptional regulator [Suipraeoptans sp.]